MADHFVAIRRISSRRKSPPSGARHCAADGCNPKRRRRTPEASTRDVFERSRNVLPSRPGPARAAPPLCVPFCCRLRPRHTRKARQEPEETLSPTGFPVWPSYTIGTIDSTESADARNSRSRSPPSLKTSGKLLGKTQIAVVRSEDAPWRDATWGERKRIAAAHVGLPAPGAPCGQASDGMVARAVSFTRARGRRVRDPRVEHFARRPVRPRRKIVAGFWRLAVCSG